MSGMRAVILCALLLLLASVAFASDVEEANNLALVNQCTKDSDCEANHFCKSPITPAGGSMCVASPLLEDYDWHQTMHLVLLGVAAFVAAGAGGNGVNSVNIPVMIALLSLSPFEVTPWAHIVSLGTSVSFCTFAAFQSHPQYTGVSLFNLEAVLLMTPGFMAGNFMGALFAGSFPRWFMFTLLMALEGLVLYKSINKLREIWTVTDDPAIDFNETNLLLREAKKLDQEEELIPMDEHMHKDPEPDFWWQFASIVLLNFAVQVLDVIRGGREHIGDVSVAGIDICSRTYWTIAGVEIFLFIGSAIVIPLVFIPRAARLKSREMFHLGANLEWSWLSYLGYFSVSLIGGLCSSMIGTAAPLLIIMFILKLRPEVIVATDAFMHLLNSTGVATGYIMAGFNDWSYISIVFSVALAGQVIGTFFVIWATRHGWSMQQAAMFSLTVMVSLALVLLVAFGTIDIIYDVKNNRHLTWNMIICQNRNQ